MFKILSLVVILLTVNSCAIFRLAGYSMRPDYPDFVSDDVHQIAGLDDRVLVEVSEAGVPRIVASSETDAMFMTGYLQARDRMAQMDILRHLAKGEVSSLIGKVPFGMKTSLDVDIFNRFMGFSDQGAEIFRRTSQVEKSALVAFTNGVNAWINEGNLPLEHRLLGVDKIVPWVPEDSLAIYQMLMFGLSGNHDREIRRLLVACESGLETLKRIWPMGVEFGVYMLDAEDIGSTRYQRPPAIVDEMRNELARLCPAEKGADGGNDDVPDAIQNPINSGSIEGWAIEVARSLVTLHQGWSASNNWVIAGQHTKSGKPILANDPHLPHMNPPILWGLEQDMPGLRVQGFTLPGLHRVVFGHNGKVVWGATTNHVDRQDLVVHKAKGAGYELDGNEIAFETKTASFTVKGDDPINVTARFTVDGLVLNDVEPELGTRLPLVSIRTTGIDRGTDMDSARGINYAGTASAFVQAIRLMDSGCTNWVYADQQGNIGYESPCVLPIRKTWTGEFPVPGWLSSYHWAGNVEKEKMPASQNPGRGWLATSNNRILPQDRFFTTYNNDSSPPHRFQRVAELITIEYRSKDKITPTEAAAFQMDVEDFGWRYSQDMIKSSLCQGDLTGQELLSRAKYALCGWNGEMISEHVAPTVYTMLTNALIDLALADELRGGMDGWTWKYIQSLTQFEVNVQWMWLRSPADPVWDDVTTGEVETRKTMLIKALSLAVSRAEEKYGNDINDWMWGKVSPFKVKHLFASGDGMLGGLLNSKELPGIGGPTTLFKSQFSRADRDAYYGTVGPPGRFTVDLADPWASRFTLAGGQSGWPKSPHYADLVEDWHEGRERLMTAKDAPGTTRVEYHPLNPQPGD